MKQYACNPQSRKALQDAICKGLSIFEPKPIMSLSQWSDEFAYIPAGSAEPGKFVCSVAEYQREPMDAVSDPRIRKVVLVWASQTGKTQIQLNAIGYFSEYDPSYILMIQPTIARAEEVSKLRIAPMIRDTPVLRDVYPDPKSRDSGNTIDLKEFPGGYLALIGSNAPSGLASKPVRILLPDEVDRFEESAGTEGDPLALAEIRGSTYWNFKSIETSTPLIKGASRIDQSFEESDKRYYFVPCPHCGLEQILTWKRLRFETEEMPNGKVRPTTVWYDCASGGDGAGCRIEEQHKYEMVRRGRWKATAESRDHRTAGFHINALYSPWVEWSRLVHEWISAQDDQEKLQVFINTRLAETWELRGDGAEESELAKRVEPKAEVLPEGILLLTMGVDVQRDRLEASIWGWGMDKQRWAVDHLIIRKPPALPEEDPGSPWRDLDDYRRRKFQHASGKMLSIACVCVDSGDQTKVVYEYTRPRYRERVYAIKGLPGLGKPLVNGGTKPDKKTVLYSVGVDTAKERLYSSLKIDGVRPGAVHFLQSDGFTPEYFEQISAEHMIPTKRHGRVVMTFRLREGRRNEALDCAVYASAACEILRPQWEKIYRKLFGRDPLPAARTELEKELREAFKAVEDAFTEREKAQNVNAETDFDHLPIIGGLDAPKSTKKPKSWRDSWEI